MRGYDCYNCHQVNCSASSSTTTTKSIAPGKYDIADLLSKLITASHTHGKANLNNTCVAVCNCNCNCNCSSHSH